MTTRILLTGAGFTRNWGGWLAVEVWEYLLDSKYLSPDLKDLLWKHRRSGGYEAALGECQEAYYRTGSQEAQERLAKFQKALLVVFMEMDAGLKHTTFEFQRELGYSVRKFLDRFDAIFTLNQDLLLERHYLNDNIALGNPGRWTGWQIPGMRRLPSSEPPEPSFADPGNWVPSDETTIHERHLPYFKLHGSQNWRSNDGAALLVAGTGKPTLIQKMPPLGWYQSEFARYLGQADCRLVVVGYSFTDEHVNRAIADAAAPRALRMFIVDPQGVDVLDKRRDSLVYQMDPYMESVIPAIAGASRRSLRETFGADRVEHGKIRRFLE